MEFVDAGAAVSQNALRVCRLESLGFLDIGCDSLERPQLIAKKLDFP